MLSSYKRILNDVRMQFIAKPSNYVVTSTFCDSLVVSVVVVRGTVISFRSDFASETARSLHCVVSLSVTRGPGRRPTVTSNYILMPISALWTTIARSLPSSAHPPPRSTAPVPVPPGYFRLMMPIKTVQRCNYSEMGKMLSDFFHYVFPYSDIPYVGGIMNV